MMRKFLLTVFAAILLTLPALAQNAPSVLKVEPPSWWSNHSINPVRVLVRGENLNGAMVRSTKNGTKTSNVRVNKRGDYLFVDVSISPNAKSGSYPLEITTANGKAIIPFEILAPLDAKTHFQGVTSDDVIYLIMTDRFANGDVSNDNPINSPKTANDRNNPRAWHGGDFRGIKNHLDYLKELGVTAIWLTPWYDNPNGVFDCDKPWCPNTNYHGYHAIDYYAVEDHFGTLQDLRDLIEAAHKIGIKVIQDQVANHVGVQHPWAKNPPLDDWFSPFSQNTFNNSVLLSPNSSIAERNNLLHGWFNESLPDMNQDEPEVARYEIQNALWWIGATGIDGIRQDTIQYMPRTFIRDWSTAILRQYPKFYMVGEVFETDSAQTAFFQGGKTGWDGIDTKLPSDFDFNLWRTSFDVFTNKKPMRALRDVLKYDGLYANVNNITTISGNHDTDRFMSLDGATTAGAMLHLAFLLSTRGIPQIYYGE
ncbi:MAG: alpha-amylase family glycosyl hydrolase, partial [Pyrinomonadaceae bacterium]